MNADRLIDRLEGFAQILPAVVSDIDDEDARWRPDGGEWSIVEIIQHLCDEEVEDFRTRVRLTLEEPDAPWPPIDPEGWALARRYREARLDESVHEFARRRRESVRWLRSLGQPDWAKAHRHPKIGPIQAGDLLTSWAAHDALHLRQIAKRLFQMASRDGDGFTTLYAGEWHA